MHFLTRPEAQAWCAARNVALNDRQLPQPDFPEAQRSDFKIPKDSGRRMSLLHAFFFRNVPADQEILLWFYDWSVWRSGERMHMFERFRASYGENRPLAEVPAFVFSPAEREDLISFAGFAMLFLWDCHVLTESGDTWLFLSHDEIGWICSRNTSDFAWLAKYQN